MGQSSSRRSMLRAEQQRQNRAAKDRKALGRAVARLLAGCRTVLAAVAVLAALGWLATGPSSN